MTYQFQGLTVEETQALVDAVPLVTVLIAGADGNIDSEEKEWAAKMTEIRSYAHPESLHGYYQEVGKQYSEKLDHYIKTFPTDVDTRTNQISATLAELNPILQKLDINLAFSLYKSLTSFAKHVAKASGGFLRFGSISSEEAKLIDLPMITPIEIEEEEA